MEVLDGFIVGIFNYCDRWCETCAFTSRCRVFANGARAEASLDPGLKALLDAPSLPEDVPPPPPRWMQELLEELNEAANQPLSEEEREQLRPRAMPEHDSLRGRTHAYTMEVHRWLHAREYAAVGDIGDPRAVIGWFHTMISAKIVRALDGLATDTPEECDGPADHDGSAKVALLGIERSHAAWLQMVERGFASPAEVDPFVAHLVWLGEELERVFPKARAFVRPAFDEPEAVAKLWAAEGG